MKNISILEKFKTAIESLTEGEANVELNEEVVEKVEETKEEVVLAEDSAEKPKEEVVVEEEVKVEYAT